MELELSQWIGIIICALLIGISKTGIPGVGILSVPLMAGVLPARSSVGVALGMLILADIFSATYYRRHANWKYIVRLLPATFLGIVAGYFGLKVLSDQQLKPIIGAIVLAMLIIDYWRSRSDNNNNNKENSQLWFSLTMGFVAGVATMMANAAGPVMAVYLLAMRLPKTQFVGTAAWFFFIIIKSLRLRNIEHIGLL